MITELMDVKGNESLEELSTKLGHFLGLKKAVPENALRRAIQDRQYANDLIICKDAPGFLDPLLNDPKNEQYAPTPIQTETTDVEHTNGALISKAIEAFVSWGKAGFSVVDEKTLETRENACLGCPHLTAPKSTLQKLMPSKKKSDKIGSRTGNSTCKLCGCNVSNKMRLPSEVCPDKHPGKERFTRWNEPIRHQ
ncbi:hypothetical protein QQ008_07935 [Fulvivirgaceae bacterium BMA10]|uniref:Uncharacterized protein n=1 Tax=Splendidivirga corallicola TaxID=3051826 RepID=A0ABT8KKP4_9BACT|nr:hypothetical protein [Fulvivirgaceae bacterium BMA10]